MATFALDTRRSVTRISRWYISLSRKSAIPFNMPRATRRALASRAIFFGWSWQVFARPICNPCDVIHFPDRIQKSFVDSLGARRTWQYLLQTHPMNTELSVFLLRTDYFLSHSDIRRTRRMSSPEDNNGTNERLARRWIMGLNIAIENDWLLIHEGLCWAWVKNL